MNTQLSYQLAFTKYLAPLQAWISELGWAGGLTVYIGFILIVSSIAHYLIGRLQKRLAEKGLLNRSLSLVSRFFVPIEILLVCAPLLAILPRIKMPDGIQTLAIAGAKIGTVLSLVLIATKAVNVITSIYYHQLNVNRPDNLRQRRLKTQIQFLEQVADLFIAFVGIAAVLLSFERFRSFGGSLLASAGLASVIIGLAAQKSLSNLIAGFQIAFTQPIRLDDAVLVENEWGTIEEITLTYVVVRIWDLRRLILPINYFLEKPFQNWTRTSASLIGQVVFHLDFRAPLDRMREELDRILNETDLWDRDTKVLQVIDSTDRTMVVRVLVSARDSGAAWDLRCLVREQILTFLRIHHPESLPKARIELEPLDASISRSKIDRVGDRVAESATDRAIDGRPPSRPQIDRQIHTQ